MGPFFVLGDLLGMDGWVVQRLWMALVLCAAFTGAALLAKAMGVRSDAAALIAAFAYATSPRILSTIGPASIEAWPSALGSEEHTSELQSLMRLSYAVFFL